MARPRSLVCGVGLNDADYHVCVKINGKLRTCRFYSTWKDMINRCYSQKYQARNPSYIGCKVDGSWLTFSNFKRWMETQDWQGKQLDKDILFVGNKIYSPETCVFVDAATNSFTLDSAAKRGDLPVGVSYYKSQLNFQASCGNPITKKSEHIGYFACPNEAHAAWMMRKHEIALQIASMQTDQRVAEALRARYSIQPRR